MMYQNNLMGGVYGGMETSQNVIKLDLMEIGHENISNN